MQMHQWEPLSSDGRVLGLKYSFGPGTANTMAAQLDDGSWMVISPAAGPSEAALEALGAKGKVSALVAPNAFHHLGQKAWREHFPAAISYAATGSLKRLGSKSPGVPYRPIEELPLGNGVHVHQFAGMKQPDLLFDVATADGAVWFAGDLISNTQTEDLGWLPRTIFGLMGGGPGYRFNPVPSMVYLADKGQWKAAARAAFADTPPACVFPAHGDPVRQDAPAATQAILRA